MTVSVETELKSRIAALESEVAMIRDQLERTEMKAAVRRGKDEANQGLVLPARELIEKLRAKYGLQAS